MTYLNILRKWKRIVVFFTATPLTLFFLASLLNEFSISYILLALFGYVIFDLIFGGAYLFFRSYRSLRVMLFDFIAKYYDDCHFDEVDLSETKVSGLFHPRIRLFIIRKNKSKEGRKNIPRQLVSFRTYDAANGKAFIFTRDDPDDDLSLIRKYFLLHEIGHLDIFGHGLFATKQSQYRITVYFAVLIIFLNTNFRYDIYYIGYFFLLFVVAVWCNYEWAKMDGDWKRVDEENADKYALQKLNNHERNELVKIIGGKSTFFKMTSNEKIAEYRQRAFNKAISISKFKYETLTPPLFPLTIFLALVSLGSIFVRSPSRSLVIINVVIFVVFAFLYKIMIDLYYSYLHLANQLISKKISIEEFQQSPVVKYASRYTYNVEDL